MSGPFRTRGDGITLQLDPREVAVLAMVPGLIEQGSETERRLDYVAHPDDPEADARYRTLVAGSLEDLRATDRQRFDLVVAGEQVSVEVLEGFVRVVGEARLILAGRLGIEDDGWEETAGSSRDPDLALLGWLGYLQDAAVGVLMRDL